MDRWIDDHCRWPVLSSADGFLMVWAWRTKKTMHFCSPVVNYLIFIRNVAAEGRKIDESAPARVLWFAYSRLILAKLCFFFLRFFFCFDFVLGIKVMKFYKFAKLLMPFGRWGLGTEGCFQHVSFVDLYWWPRALFVPLWPCAHICRVVPLVFFS